MAISGSLRKASYNSFEAPGADAAVPTINETYLYLDLQAWQSSAAPAGTPAALVAQRHAAIAFGPVAASRFGSSIGRFRLAAADQLSSSNVGLWW